MKIHLQTKVEQDYQTVYRGFDKDLFLALKPALLPLKLLRFDGSAKGDQVHIQLGVGSWSMRWDVHIVEDHEGTAACYFIDEGLRLPFFLTKWRHKHSVQEASDGAVIIDDIYYKTPNILLDYVMYPVLYVQFAARKPVYRRYFAKS